MAVPKREEFFVLHFAKGELYYLSSTYVSFKLSKTSVDGIGNSKQSDQ